MLTTDEKCREIVRAILDNCNKNNPVGFESDFGDFTLTIMLGESHTHVGIPDPDGSFDQLVDNLYNVLHGGPGLSWAK